MTNMVVNVTMGMSDLLGDPMHVFLGHRIERQNPWRCVDCVVKQHNKLRLNLWYRDEQIDSSWWAIKTGSKSGRIIRAGCLGSFVLPHYQIIFCHKGKRAVRKGGWRLLFAVYLHTPEIWNFITLTVGIGGYDCFGWSLQYHALAFFYTCVFDILYYGMEYLFNIIFFSAARWRGF